MTEEHVGRIVDGRYRLDRLLGEGATGKVYAATQLTVDRTVAVKLLHDSDNATFKDRFETEAKAIGKLSHTNIITLHDFGFDSSLGTYFMVTEHADGVPLFDRMQEVMSTDLILKVALEIASALHHAHAQGILHRDLKPENVILARADGRVDVAKVLDFGLARLLADEQEQDAPLEAEESAPPEDDGYGYGYGYGDEEYGYGDDGHLADDEDGEEGIQTVASRAVSPGLAMSDEELDDAPATAILPPTDLSADGNPQNGENRYDE